MVVEKVDSALALALRHLWLLPWLVFFAAVLTVQGAVAQVAPPTFSKSFNPATIGPGAVSTLTLTIDNAGSATPVTGLDFTDVLPAALTIADGSASHTCVGGTMTAPSGGTTISLTGAGLGASSTCTVTVRVTASTPGTHTNTTGALTSSAGNSGTATADLTVSTVLPGFSKTITPATASIGSTVRIAYLIDNTANASNVDNLDFSETFSTGIAIASPANATTTCGTATIPATLTAPPGGATVTLDSDGTGAFPAVAAGATCTVSVDIVAGATGTFNLQSGELLADFVSAGTSSAVLTVPATSGLQITKEFTDDPVAPGGAATLEFAITNLDRDFAATSVAFTDALGTMLGGTTFDNLLFNDCGGSVTGVGTTDITFSGGSVASGATCAIRVDVGVPGGAAAGPYTNTTTAITGTINGTGVTGNIASHDLTVLAAQALIFSKSFSPGNVSAGSPVTLSFMVSNPNTTAGYEATDVEFGDELTTFLPFPVSVTLPPVPNPPCGAGSSLALVSFGTDRQGLELTGGDIAVGGSCTFDVSIGIPGELPGGIYTNTAETLTATVNGGTVATPGASASFTVSGGVNLSFSKEFTDDPVIAGNTATLAFTISSASESAFDADNVSFSDVLDATLAGVVAVAPLPTNVCGDGTLSGTSTLSLAGATLSPGETCTFQITVQVPAGAATGDYTNTTSDLTADASGLPITVPPASDDLRVFAFDNAPLTLAKEFLTDPALPGQAITLRFTVANLNPTNDGTITVFTDSLTSALPGLAATGAPTTDTCGGTLSGTIFLTYTGGTVLAGTDCTIEIPVLVPTGATSGIYSNVTSSLSSSFGTSDPATANLEVIAEPLTFTKEFTDNPVPPGDTGTLAFTIENIFTDQATAIDFSDDLDGMLTGAAASSVVSNTCGGTPSLGSTFTLTGATLNGAASCAVQVTVSVPPAAADGNYPNTATITAATIDGLDVSGSVANDTLTVFSGTPPTFTKEFTDDPVGAGGTVTLRYTIDNAAGGAISALAFTDDLDAALSGLAATGLPASNVCGTGSQISGTSFLTFSGGELAAAGSCTFDVTLQVPLAASPGSYLNTTSDLTSGGLTVTPAASDTLVIEPAPSFAKSFAPNPILTDGVATLTFTIDNSAASVNATALDFIDNLPAGVVVATPANAGATCTGGTLTAADGASTVSYSGGTAAAAASCTVSVDVTATASGNFVNTTGDLTSSLGNSGTASDTLAVTDRPPLFAKTFAPDAILVGETSTLTFDIDNSGASADATALDFTDNLPANVVVASPANAGTTCTGGTLTAADGASTISYSGGSVPASSACSVNVDVTATVPGSYVNTTGDLTSSLGNSGSATDMLGVTDGPPLFFKAFSATRMRIGDVVSLTFTIDNTASTTGATALDFSDMLPAGLIVGNPAGAGTTCSGGALAAAPGSSLITYTGGAISDSASCTVMVNIEASAPGNYTNVSGDLTSSLGNSGPATAQIDVVDVTPLFSKAFSPDTILIGEVSTLSFEIDNSAASTDATALAFTDAFLANLTVAVTPNASTTCTGGTLTATAGASSVSYSGGTVTGGASCTIQVDVAASAPGSYANVSGDLTSSAGNSGTATATLTVADPDADLSVTLSDDVDPILAGNLLTYTSTVSNAGPQAATNTVATMTLPVGVTFQSSSGCAEDPNGVPTCSLGDIAAAGNAAFTFTVLVDTGTSGIITSDVAVSSDIGDADSSNNSASEDTTVNTPAGTITIVKNTAPVLAGDGTFEFTSADTELDAISLTTVSNTATTGALMKTAGAYTIREDTQAGWRLDSIVCAGDTDNGSTVDLTVNSVTIDLDNAEAIVCTFTNVRDEDAVIEQTQAVIMEFMEQRADKITSNSPDLISRLRDRMPGGSTMGNAHGSATEYTSNFGFSTSLAEMRAYQNSLVGDGTGEVPRFDVWLETVFTHNTTDTSNTHFGQLTAGADYLVNPNFLVGGIFQVDWAGLNSKPAGTSADGVGWMAGPYFVVRPWQNIYIDGRIEWGQSSNHVNPLGLYTDPFSTDRWLASSKIAGDYFVGNLRITPAAEVIYFEETQKSYVDSLSITIPSQTLSIGRLIAGPEFTYTMKLDNGVVIIPSLAFEGIWDFYRTASSSVASTAASTSDVRGKVNLGVGISTPNGISLSAGAFYDGIGVDGYDTVGGKIKLTVPIR
jgi:uncharacterized repeat protein (TIGR01451 family)